MQPPPKFGNEIFDNCRMKIRIQGNSIRFRLKQFEVEAFRKNGIVEEAIAFGDEAQEQILFILKLEQEQRFSIEQNGTNIQVNVPRVIADDWTSTELVGFEEKILTTKGKEIFVLVEKDFKCLDRSDEEEAGSYPNPMKQC